MNLAKSRSCAGKRRYASAAAAAHALSDARRREPDKVLHYYQCRHCEGFHLGHPDRQTQRCRRYDRLLAAIAKANKPPKPARFSRAMRDSQNPG